MASAMIAEGSFRAAWDIHSRGRFRLGDVPHVYTTEEAPASQASGAWTDVARRLVPAVGATEIVVAINGAASSALQAFKGALDEAGHNVAA
jgi:hypothetical protein